MLLGNTTSPQVNGTSARPVVTTGGLPMTTAAASSSSKVALGFKLQQNFTSELANKSSPQFLELEKKTVDAVSSKRLNFS